MNSQVTSSISQRLHVPHIRYVYQIVRPRSTHSESTLNTAYHIGVHGRYGSGSHGKISGVAQNHDLDHSYGARPQEVREVQRDEAQPRQKTPYFHLDLGEPL